MSNVSPFSEVRFVVKSIESRGFIWKESVLCHKETQLTRCTWCSCSDTIYSPERLLGLLMPFKLDLVMVQISTVTVYIPEWLIMLVTDENAVLLSQEINDDARRSSLTRSAHKKESFVIIIVIIMLTLFAVLLFADIALRAVGTHLLISKVGNKCFQLRLFYIFYNILLPVRADWKNWTESWFVNQTENIQQLNVFRLRNYRLFLTSEIHCHNITTGQFILYSMGNYILLIFAWLGLQVLYWDWFHAKSIPTFLRSFCIQILF